MDTHTSIIYSVTKHNDNTIKHIEYNSTIKDGDKMMNTHYKNTVNNEELQESFTKLYRDRDIIYEQLGNSRNRADWFVKEYQNNNFQKQYMEDYNKHTFNDCIMDTMPSLVKLNDNFLLDNK